MKRPLTQFIATLRAAGLRISTAEAIDAARAVASVGLGLPEFREALAATLIKDEADRPVFDETFESFFFPAERRRRKLLRPPPGAGSGGVAPRAQEGSGRSPAADRPMQPSRQPQPMAERQAAQPRRGEQLRRERELTKRNFADLQPDEIDACLLLAQRLARRLQANRRRRLRRRYAGRLDIRRTLREAITTGGVPLALRFRRARPGPPDLLALCDISHSVAVPARFLLSLLRPAPEWFRHTRLYGFIDRPVAIELAGGEIVPSEPIDLYARSDYGRTFAALWEAAGARIHRNTVVLILGDARSNRRPPRADLLVRMRRSARKLVWLNPESPARWNTGDSVLASYQRGIDVLLAASNPQQLVRALESGLLR